MRKIIKAAFISMFMCQMHAQTSFYVDNLNGSDTNSGTSLDQAWKSIQNACNQVPPNSTVFIKGGTYFENISVNVSGTPNAEIIFRNYINDQVIIDGSYSTTNTLIDITDKNYLRFENLIIKNLTTFDARGIDVGTTATGSCTGLVFRNITITNINWIDDPLVVPSNTDNAHGLNIKGKNGGISNLLIDSCHIFNNITGYSEALSISGNVYNFEVKNCKIHDNTNIGIDIAGNYGAAANPALDFPREGVIKNNTCYNNVSLVAQSAGIYIDGAEDIVIERNRCFQNGLGIEVGCEENGTAKYIKVKNNLVYKNLKSGLAIGGYTTETTGEVLFCTIRNNTFFQNCTSNNSSGEIQISKASNCVFEDNLFFTGPQNILLATYSITPQTGNLINYNSWFTPSGSPNQITVYWGESTYHTFQSYQNGTSQESNSVFGDPGLIDTSLPEPELLLSGFGTCIDNGNPDLSVSADETDYDGNPRITNGIIDIGAREFQNILFNEPFKELGFSTHPNPFEEQTTISFGHELTNANFELFDITGRIVRKIENISGSELVVYRDGLANGIYIYKISEPDKAFAEGRIVAK